MALKDFIRGNPAKNDDEMSDLMALKQDMLSERTRVAEMEKLERRFGWSKLSDEQRRFYETEVLATERKHEAERPAREAREDAARKAQEAHKVEVLAAPRDDYIIYRDGHRITQKALVCSCGATIGYNVYFEKYLLLVDARKGGPSELNDIGNIRTLKGTFNQSCACGKKHDYSIVRVPA